jgi:predicted esterase
MDAPISRRRLLGIGVGAGALAAAGLAVVPELLGQGDGETPGPVPEAAVGDERVEGQRSEARGKTVDFYTAVPAGHGDGRGLPVCLILHGASATAADYPGFGFGKFLTDAVERGAAPFVLAGADGGVLRWEADGSDDPRRMVHDEMPRWCEQRGFDTGRLAVWGWSMGGYGALRFCQAHPGFARAVAAFSPACARGDRVFADVAKLNGTPVGLWCGLQDGLHDTVVALEQALPEGKAAGTYADGRHSRRYWNRCTPGAFDFLAAQLARPR